MTFHTLAAQTEWVEDKLKVLFRRGLSHELQAESACRDEGRTLNEFITFIPKLKVVILRLKIPVKISINGKMISTSALLDSGAAGNFMSYVFAQQHTHTNVVLFSFGSGGAR